MTIPLTILAALCVLLVAALIWQHERHDKMLHERTEDYMAGLLDVTATAMRDDSQKFALLQQFAAQSSFEAPSTEEEEAAEAWNALSPDERDAQTEQETDNAEAGRTGAKLGHPESPVEGLEELVAEAGRGERPFAR